MSLQKCDAIIKMNLAAFMRRSIPCKIPSVALNSPSERSVIVLAVVTIAEIVAILVVAAVAIALEFASPKSCVSDVLPGMLVESLVNMLAGARTGIGVEVLAGASESLFASLVSALDFAAPEPSRGVASC